MFTPGEIEGIPLAIERQFGDLEVRIMEDIVRRIRINGEVTRSADWQLHRLHELGMSDRVVREYIQNCLEYSEREMDELYYNVLRTGYYRDGALYRKTGKDQLPFEENTGLQQLISAVSDQTSGEMKNITQSLGFAVRENGRLKFLPIADYYQRTLDGAMLDISSGAFDYNTVLRRVTKELTNSGLRTVDYATGRKIRVESAARMCVMTGFSQLTAKVNEDNAKQLGTEYFEVTYHGGARPEHQVWQGRIYSKKQLETVCGLGAPDGLRGCNCHHDYYPFSPGISERAYTDEELDRLNREENTPVEYHGREYTKYQATQRQRSLERSMRASRQEIKLLKEGGASEEEIMLARGRYRALSAEYTHFSNAMNLPQQRERVTVDGLGNIGAGKYTPTKSPQTIPSLGSRITDRVTPEERRELLKQGVPSIGEQLVNVLNARKEQVEKGIANSSESGIIESNKGETAGNNVHILGTIDINIYRCVTQDIQTDEVIITDRQIEHIKERHPNDYERYFAYFQEIIQFPDYILEANRPNTAFVLKHIVENGKNYQLILRLKTSTDPKDYKNSVITFLKVDDRKWRKYLRNKKILYSKEND